MKYSTSSQGWPVMIYINVRFHGKRTFRHLDELKYLCENWEWNENMHIVASAGYRRSTAPEWISVATACRLIQAIFGAPLMATDKRWRLKSSRPVAAEMWNRLTLKTGGNRNSTATDSAFLSMPIEWMFSSACKAGNMSPFLAHFSRWGVLGEKKLGVTLLLHLEKSRNRVNSTAFNSRSGRSIFPSF